MVRLSEASRHAADIGLLPRLSGSLRVMPNCRKCSRETLCSLLKNARAWLGSASRYGWVWWCLPTLPIVDVDKSALDDAPGRSSQHQIVTFSANCGQSQLTSCDASSMRVEIPSWLTKWSQNATTKL